MESRLPESIFMRITLCFFLVIIATLVGWNAKPLFAQSDSNAFEAQSSNDVSANNDTPAQWYKGNLHTHTLWSDGDDFPEMVADWYRGHGYHFLALSDHNILSQGFKWMPISKVESRGGKEVLPKYLAKFGKDWVQMRNNTESNDLEVRLKPLDEVRALVESTGEFLMISSQEITDKHAHINATNILEKIAPQGGATVREMIQNNLRAVDAQAKQTGRIILPHLNHPNLGDKGISAEDLAALVEDEFFEVWNGVEGDAQFTTQFIGTPKRFDETTSPRALSPSNSETSETLDYSADVGKVFATVTGLKATYTLTGDELYVRATITSDKPPTNPTQESPYQKAWTQPVGW
jgi:hypothetical protein